MSSDIGMQTLTDLALNLRWSWNRSADELWAQLDPELWPAGRRPNSPGKWRIGDGPHSRA